MFRAVAKVCFSNPPENYALTHTELYKWVQAMNPLYAPKQASTYSNLAFELLGLVLEKVTGLSYDDCIDSLVTGPLGMNHTTFQKPKDSQAVIPIGGWYWDVDEGVQKP